MLRCLTASYFRHTLDTLMMRAMMPPRCHDAAAAHAPPYVAITLLLTRYAMFADTCRYADATATARCRAAIRY